MDSVIYKATVMHNRMKPTPHRFHNKVFMFYINLDEIALLKKKLLMFSHNRFNFFSFRDSEHLQLPIESPDKTKGTKEHICDYLKANGITEQPHKIMLLTNLNVLGYNFNPVSFYYCFDKENKPICCVAEVSNTFREMKPYLLDIKTLNDSGFHLNTTKYFYVSPFIEHDANFDFNLGIPGEKLNIRIDDFKDGKRFFISTVTGIQKKLNYLNLLWYSIRFPFITIRIIILIHWHALMLWRKKITFHKKAENKDLQQGVFRKYQE